jgi:hypothetical protein
MSNFGDVTKGTITKPYRFDSGVENTLLKRQESAPFSRSKYGDSKVTPELGNNYSQHQYFFDQGTEIDPNAIEPL